jgi:hypothetical protein
MSNFPRLMVEKIPCMPQQNVAHVVYAIENTKLSSMPNVAIFHVLCAISVRCSWILLLGMSVGGEIPYFLHRSPMRGPPTGRRCAGTRALRRRAPA